MPKRTDLRRACSEGKIMQIEKCYKESGHSSFARLYMRKIWIILFILAFLICLIVNLAKGFSPWLGIVGISMILFFVTFIDRPLLENTFINRLQRIFVWAGILLIYLAVFYSEKVWQALPIVLSSEVLFINFLLLIRAKKRTKNTLRFSFLLFAVAALIAALCVSILQKYWVGFLLFGLAVLSCAFVLFIYRGQLKNELQWRIFGENKKRSLRRE